MPPLLGCGLGTLSGVATVGQFFALLPYRQFLPTVLFQAFGPPDPPTHTPTLPPPMPLIPIDAPLPPIASALIMYVAYERSAVPSKGGGGLPQDKLEIH